MSTLTPLIVTHSCALVRDGLQPDIGQIPLSAVHILLRLTKKPKAIWLQQGPVFGS